MRDASRRPMGRLFYWVLLGVAAAFGFRLSALGAAPQNEVETTTVADTVYLADGTKPAGTLIITWPGFVTMDARNTSRQDTELEATKARVQRLEQIATTTTEARIRTEVQLGELREGQNEIKALIQAHDRVGRKGSTGN